MKLCIITITLLLLTLNPAWAGTKIEVFPQVRYDQFIIYESLVIFWLAIIGLIIIIKMKLREIERTQRLKLDKEDDNIPSLK